MQAIETAPKKLNQFFLFLMSFNLPSEFGMSPVCLKASVALAPHGTHIFEGNSGESSSFYAKERFPTIADKLEKRGVDSCAQSRSTDVLYGSWLAICQGMFCCCRYCCVLLEMLQVWITLECCRNVITQNLISICYINISAKDVQRQAMVKTETSPNMNTANTKSVMLTNTRICKALSTPSNPHTSISKG